MAQVFISYRHHDSVDITGRLYDRLTAQFGRENIFIDEDGIPLGIDFRQRLRNSICQCDVLLAIIGDRWLDARHETGPRQNERRLDDPQDYVIAELRWALVLGVPVVPVLVGRAAMPSDNALPVGVKELSFRNAAEVRSGADFHSHVDRLIRRLQELEKQRQLPHELQNAAVVIAEDRELALLRARKLLEIVIRRVYTIRIGSAADTASTQKLAESLISASLLPNCLDVLQALRDVGSKPLELTTGEARQWFSKIMEILEWHRDFEITPAPNESTAQPAPAEPSSYPSWKEGQLKLQSLLEEALRRSHGGPLAEADQLLATEICVSHRLPPEFADDIFHEVKKRVEIASGNPSRVRPKSIHPLGNENHAPRRRRPWRIYAAGLFACILCAGGAWVWSLAFPADSKTPREENPPATNFVEETKKPQVPITSDAKEKELLAVEKPIMKDPMVEEPIKKHPKPPASPVPGEIWTNTLGMNFAWIPPGKFMRGSPPEEKNRWPDEGYSEASVKKGFWMGVTEVTQEQWLAIMPTNPSKFKGDNHPVDSVSWKLCHHFCELLAQKDPGRKYRLPTELE